MANAVFSSYEAYLDKDKSNSCEHSSFDLSHIRSFTTTYGALVPFYLEDCLPSDHFDIKNVVKIQALPMSNPLFNNIRVETWYFYVPYYLLWRKFDLFIGGGRDGTYSAQLPYTKICPSHNSLSDYFGFPITKDSSGSGLTFDVSAFPFAAYQRIYRDYFLNQDLQTSTNTNWWFPADDDEFTLADGLNYFLYKDQKFGSANVQTAYDAGSGSFSCAGSYSDIASSFADMTKDCAMLQCIRFKNFKRDYFTSAMFSPQRGPAMGLGPTTLSPFVPSDFTDFVDTTTSSLTDQNAIRFGDGTGKAYTKINQGTTATGADYANKAGSSLLKFLANLGNKYSSGMANGLTISDIMTASQIQLWLERNMQVKAQYNEFLRVHFGDAPLDERLTKPYYIGGTSQSIQVSSVLQMSESGTTPQGTQTGHASSIDSQFVGKFTSHEFGLIMGIMCIVPEVYYTTGIDKKWTKKSRYDFVFPEFAQLPPEPILNKELFLDNTSSSTLALGESVFGYCGRYDNYRHRQNMAVGDLRNPSMADFFSWTITRTFSSTPSLNDWNFTSTLKNLGGVMVLPPRDSSTTPPTDYNNIRLDHFPTGNSVNPFIVQVGLSIKANRPLPFRNVPSTLGLRRG